MKNFMTVPSHFAHYFVATALFSNDICRYVLCKILLCASYCTKV